MLLGSVFEKNIPFIIMLVAAMYVVIQALILFILLCIYSSFVITIVFLLI